MKPIVGDILRGAGGLLLGLYKTIVARREGKRQATAREVLADSPSTIPAARARAEAALRRRQDAERRSRETGLPEVDEAVREMLAETRRDGGR